jgi:quercetin dioxygenase-like cupin family protein
MSASPVVYKWDEMPKEVLFNGDLTRTAIRSDGAIVTLNWHKPSDTRHKLHSHPFDQLVLIVSGTLVIVIEDKEYVMGPGTALRIPASVPHTGYAIGDEDVLNIDIFAPAREDYLFLAANQNEYGAVPEKQSKGGIPSLAPATVK